MLHLPDRRGAVYGASDEQGAYPENSRCIRNDLVAALYHALEIDRQTSYRDTLDRPWQRVEHGDAVSGLF